MNKISFGVGVVIVALSCVSPARAQSTFSDVPDNHWAAAAVKKLAEAGIVEGRPGTANRAQQVASLAEQAAQLSLRLKSALDAEAALKGAKLALDTSRLTHTVTLRGTATTAAQKERALAIVQREAPGHAVVNRVRVETPAKSKTVAAQMVGAWFVGDGYNEPANKWVQTFDAVQKALKQNSALKGSMIEIDGFRAKDGTQEITLMGVVANAAQSKLAVDIARAAGGDTKIINELKVQKRPMAKRQTKRA